MCNADMYRRVFNATIYKYPFALLSKPSNLADYHVTSNLEAFLVACFFVKFVLSLSRQVYLLVFKPHMQEHCGQEPVARVVI